MENITKIIESLSPNERKILTYLGEESLIEISKKSQLDKVSVLRALEYLQNKNLVSLETEKRKIIHVGINGALYRKKGLPERRLLNLLEEKRVISLEEAKKSGELSEEELKASIGALKKKAMIEIKNEKIFLTATKQEIIKKTLEEIFIEKLPLNLDDLSPENQYALKSLQNRKEIVEIIEEKEIKVFLTELGKEIISHAGKTKEENLIEALTPEILRDEKLWKGKKFRRYDISSPLPEITGGKRHFVNQALDYARNIWTDLGFKEMTGPLVVSSFWCFDALFQPQDHPAREMADTFFINKKSNLEDINKKLIKNTKESHEKGLGGSKGWNYQWDEEIAKKLVLRTHTTSISSETLSKLNPEKDLPCKFFALGKCFRNETVDWSHGFEFNQTEGIVVDPEANFRHLLGYLKEFFTKMGYEKIRFRPCYYPYTEPSVEISFWHEEKQTWLELGGAGMFRPEVTIPIFGKHIPVLAWGPGFDRIIMTYYNIKDLRDMYKNNITQLRKIKSWIK